LALYQLATALELVGKYEETLECCEEWATIQGEKFAPASHGLIAAEKSRAYSGLGQYSRAVAEALRALDFFAEASGWEDRATTQELLGNAHHGLGDFEEARRWWMEALVAYEHVQHPGMDVVRAKLAALPEN
jgi:tetratricopeptide (TPR) repeat protein